MNMISKGCLALLLTVACNMAYAASDAPFPKGWESWPVTSKGAIPANSAPIPTDIPPIVQETIKTYNWINDGKGSAYNIRFNPAQKPSLTAGKPKDGASAVIEFTDIKVIFVTEHLLGEPQYGVYSYEGKDLSSAHASLGLGTCVKCHSGYKEFCKKGVCSKF